jgi:membrane protease YdiL (CAAX protease family)
MMSHRKRFWFACGFEAMLLLLAAGLSRVSSQPWQADLRWSLGAAGWGLVAVGPLLAGFLLLLRARGGPLAAVREFLEQRVRPFFADWSVLELAALSVVAGVSEEVFFRAMLHGGLAPLLGQPLAILVASAAFGLCHPISLAYALSTSLVGVYFSALWLFTGNLLAPVLAHGVYDFVALMCLLRRSPGRLDGGT